MSQGRSVYNYLGDNWLQFLSTDVDTQTGSSSSPLSGISEFTSPFAGVRLPSQSLLNGTLQPASGIPEVSSGFGTVSQHDQSTPQVNTQDAVTALNTLLQKTDEMHRSLTIQSERQRQSINAKHDIRMRNLKALRTGWTREYQKELEELEDRTSDANRQMRESRLEIMGVANLLGISPSSLGGPSWINGPSSQATSHKHDLRGGSRAAETWSGKHSTAGGRMI